MKKVLLLGVMLMITLALCIGIGYYVYQFQELVQLESKQELAQKEENIRVQKINEANLQISEIVSTKEEIITPHTQFITKEIYTKCGHTVENEVPISDKIVNLKKSDIETQYIGWDVDSFSKEKVILSRKFDRMCPEHYILKEEDGYIAIYHTDENGKQSLVEVTGIATEYLPQLDQIRLKEGVQAIGKTQLNRVIEDYE